MSNDKTEDASPLEERLRADTKDAMRAHDQVRTDTLRMALNAFHLEEVARTDEKSKQFRQPLSEQDRLGIVEKQVKQREEAAQIYRTAGRTNQADKEDREAALLKAYLPAALGDDELRALIEQLIAIHGKDFRAVMPAAARETRGRADGRRVQELVRELTA
jgi:uncharacterized protein YqeY